MSNLSNTIGTIIRPISKMKWEELSEGLAEEILTGRVNRIDGVGHQSHLSLYNYTDECSFSRAWNSYNTLARGLVLDHQSNCVAALPFPKFFNLFEVNKSNLPDLPFEAFEKLDGSLGIVFYNTVTQSWNVCTRGSFTSDQSIWATNWLKRKCKVNQLDSSITYLVEIIYPANQVVVDYGAFEGLVLLGGYRKDDFSEIDLEEWSNCFQGRVVGYSFASIDHIQAYCKTLTHNDEGVVVRFSNGFRIKIKGEEYCRVHAIKSDLTPLNIWRAMSEGLNLEEIKTHVPEELLVRYEEIEDILNERFNQMLAESSYLLESLSDLPRKDQIQRIQSELPEHLWPVSICLLSNKNPSTYLWKYLRPDGNQL